MMDYIASLTWQFITQILIDDKDLSNFFYYYFKNNLRKYFLNNYLPSLDAFSAVVEAILLISSTTKVFQPFNVEYSLLRNKYCTVTHIKVKKKQ